MRQSNKRLDWFRGRVWILWPAFVWACIALLLISCRTVEVTEQTHTTHTHEADTLSTEARHDGHAQQQTVNLDSIVSVIMQHVQEEINRQEQEHETTTETLTETIDSLGRIVRQTQKTTDRTTSRQEQQRTDRLEQSVRQELHAAIERQDSVWRERFSQYQASVRDSLASIRDYRKTAEASQPLSWWARAWTWLRGILLGIVIGIIIVLWRNVYADFKRIARWGIDKFYHHNGTD